MKTADHLIAAFCQLFKHAFAKIQSGGLIAILSIIMLCSPAAHAQTSTGINLTPVISLLLFDGCPVVTAATTVMGDKTISNQSDLDALQGTTRIEGDLRFVTPPSTLDFTPLDSVVEVMGDIDIRNTALTSISGFDCLKSISGNLDIRNNDALTSLTDFSALTSISGFLQIFNNDALTSLTGFSALTSISGSLSISNNAALTSLTGFSALTSISGFLNISNNAALTSLTGFSALTSISGFLQIFNNAALTSLTGFSALTSISASLQISNNAALTSLTDFSALTSISGSLSISNNAALTSLPGFSALTSITGNLSISNNAALASISGFSALNAIGRDIIVANNTNFDCTNPVPTFVPVTRSTGNRVNCSPVEFSRTRILSSPIDIPDADSNGILDAITINNHPGTTIDQLTVDLDISHTYVNDLRVTLTNGATTLSLVIRPTTQTGDNCTSNNINVELSDTPASLPPINTSCATSSAAEAFTDPIYRPSQPLSGFKNNNVNGTWTLKVIDVNSSDTGTLNSWGLNFTKNRL